MVIPFALLMAKGWGRAHYDPLLEPLALRDYVTTQLSFMVTYLRQIVWPTALVFDYGRHICSEPACYLPGLVLVVVAVGGTLWGLWRNAPLAFAGVAYFGILAPTSTIIKITTQTGAEHRLYLVSAVPILLVVLGGHLAWKRWAAGRRSVAVAACLLVAAPLSWQTRQRNLDYRSDVAIWGDTARKWPTNARAHLNYGAVLGTAGRFRESIPELDRAIALKPRLYDAYLNRAKAYGALGQNERALADLAKAIELRPDRVAPYHLRGRALAYTGKLVDAVAQYDKALELDPSFGKAYFDRGMARMQLRLVQPAIEDFSRSIELGVKVLAALNNRSVAYANLGQYDKARADVEAIKRAGGKPNARVEAFLRQAGR
jgi:Flp pilus assembly protein TadD